jgi:transcriptional regulator with XRE-family HTH domain
MATNITDAELQQLLTEGLSQNEIARRTNIPRSTLRRRLEKLGTPKVHTGVPDEPNEGISNVYQSTQTQNEQTKIGDELQAMLDWWRERRRALQIRDDPEQETERKTYHVQKRYIEAIERASDLEHVSITEIVNRAFAHYFNREHE